VTPEPNIVEPPTTKILNASSFFCNEKSGPLKPCELIVIVLKDAASPVLVQDLSDKNSFHVVMPMKI